MAGPGSSMSIELGRYGVPSAFVMPAEAWTLGTGPRAAMRGIAALTFGVSWLSPPPRHGPRGPDRKLKTMSDTPPDRLSVNPDSPHYDADLLERGIGIRFKGVEKTNVEEYCISEKWVRVAAGKTMDRKGNPMTIKLQGDVEAYFRDTAEG